MSKIIFITGGARSGKSSFAETLLNDKDDVLYIATGIPFDDEMRGRIAMHKSRRNSRWETIEAYKDFDKVVEQSISGKKNILFDCVTLMVSNLMILENKIDWDSAGKETADIIEKNILNEINKLLDVARHFNCVLVIVSNELGMGIVPDTALGRYFRDIAGRVNQRIAGAAHEVYLMVSGIPLKIKG